MAPTIKAPLSSYKEFFSPRVKRVMFFAVIIGTQEAIMIRHNGQKNPSIRHLFFPQTTAAFSEIFRINFVGYGMHSRGEEKSLRSHYGDYARPPGSLLRVCYAKSSSFILCKYFLKILKPRDHLSINPKYVFLKNNISIGESVAQSDLLKKLWFIDGYCVFFQARWCPAAGACARD